MQDRFPELMAWLERHPVSYTVLTLAALITLAWVADWLTKHILLRSVNRVLKSTSLADDPEVRALRVISRLAHVVPALVLAGGLSRRMGMDKTRLQLAGQSMIEHVVAALRTPKLAAGRSDALLKLTVAM